MTSDHVDLAIINRAKEDNVSLIQLQFTDIHGSIKAVTIPIEKFPEALEKGIWFDGSSIEGFTRICESDMFLKPDTSTYALLPWETKGAMARLFCDIHMPDGSPFEGDPRYILKRAIAHARSLNYEFNVGPELEFFLFKPKNDGRVEPTPHDVGSYFDFSPRDLAGDVRRDIIFALEKMGLNVEMSHHEVAPGQHEIDFKYAEALKTAENALTFKQVVKSIAHRHDLYATFMPKPIFGVCGSGMHCHQSFFDINTGDNAFFDEKNAYKLSKLAIQFISGQLHHVRAMSAVLSPTVNSYKRLVPGYEAPVYICWGQTNRSALIRVPRYSPGREKATRVELRCPDPSNNPYLALAVMLEAGLDGIAQEMSPPNPVEENVYEFDVTELTYRNIATLPGSLGEAISELKKSTLMEQALGSHTYQLYVHSKMAEWNEYRIQVTDWEQKKYFETT
ncbi:MAG: type I glutamate--ammonia ligase [Candidatus Brocadiaceae bacterium]|nr:type I glutamate--ammonia ligase [Candidatus Brocadiaceae bacterium]